MVEPEAARPVNSGARNKNGCSMRFGIPSLATCDRAEASSFSANSRKKPTKFTAELDDPSSTTITPPLRERLSVYRKYAGTPFWERGGNSAPKTTSRDFELTHDSAILLPVANRSSAGMNLVNLVSIQRFEEKGKREIGGLQRTARTAKGRTVAGGDGFLRIRAFSPSRFHSREHSASSVFPIES